MLDLPDVTLVAVTSVALPQTIRAMRLSLDQIRFGAVVLLSDQPPPADSPAVIEWRRIAPLPSRDAYSRFMLTELYRHVETDHVLCVQWDGYVLDARNWLPAFLDYDYIGAPWPHFDDGHDVGNGGFSLRSRRLLDACVALGIDGSPEDVAICRRHRDRLERQYAIRFAPQAHARRFAYERHAPRGGEFGFHGLFNLIDLVDAPVFAKLVEELDPGVASLAEHRELIGLALRRRRFGLARLLWRRLRARRRLLSTRIAANQRG